MWRAALIRAGALLMLAVPRASVAQPALEPRGPNARRIVALDSTELGAITVSPDGRWIVVGTLCSSTACSAPWGAEDGLWILPADGSARPTRLMSGGYIDRWPAWFPSGDRLAFVSDRAARDGSHKTYVMTVGFDTRTGKAVGTPRQISTEEVAFLGQVSPDGKWVSFGIQSEQAIKILPSNGGTARTLVKMEKATPPFRWSADGKWVHFIVREEPTLPPFGGVWYKVGVEGGKATRAYANPAAMPYPGNADQHVVFVRGADGRGISRLELYDAKNRLVGASDVPSDMRLHFPRSGSGGFYGTTSNRQYENSIVTLDGGRTRRVAASRFAWVNGWIDNATLSIDGRDSSGKMMVATLDTAGHEGKHVLLSSDFGVCCGWNGIMGSRVSVWRDTALYSVDARTGTLTKLADKLAGGDAVWNSFGRGGFFGDGDRFIATVVNGKRLELRAFTASGQSILLRSFAASDSLVRTAVHGDLVAWAIASRDSVTIFAARGPDGVPHRLTAQRFKPGRFYQLTWSFDASMLAINGLTADPPLSVVRVDPSGAARGAPVVLNAQATEPWSLRWTPDDRAVLVIATPPGARDEVLMRVSLDPAVAPTLYGEVNEWMFVSPDGKRVAYPAVRTLGTTVWRMEFVAASRR